MIVLLCIVSLALAEPPVGDSYLEAAQSLHDHGSHQKYIPDLTAPSVRHQASFNSDQHAVSTSRRVSQEYGTPDFRDNLSQVYGTPNTYQSSNFRTLSQGYDVPAHISQYDAFNSNLGQRFSPALKTGVSQRYGAPSNRNIPSGSYGLPSQRSLSTQYGLPDTVPEDSSRRSFTRNSSPVQKYGVPSFQSRKSHSEFSSQSHDSSNSGLPSLRSSTYHGARTFPSQVHGSSRALSTQYGAPEARNAVYPEHPEDKYGVPSARSLSQEYGQPAGRSTGLKTNAYTSSYSTIKSPSQGYGVPQSRDIMPSNQYGAPSDALLDQGYQYARNALDLLNQEPANYEFAYKVDDYESGSDFGHVESRQEDKAEGAYFVVLPDGTKQVVEYEADEDGFKPRISVVPADSETRNAEGPY